MELMHVMHRYDQGPFYNGVVESSKKGVLLVLISRGETLMQVCSLKSNLLFELLT